MENHTRAAGQLRFRASAPPCALATAALSTEQINSLVPAMNQIRPEVAVKPFRAIERLARPLRYLPSDVLEAPKAAHGLALAGATTVAMVETAMRAAMRDFMVCS